MGSGVDMAASPTSLLVRKQDVPEKRVHQQIELPTVGDDGYGGVHIEIKELMDSKVFTSWFKASLPKWRQLGKKCVWIELPTKLAGLVEAAVQAGFQYHHAEPDHLTLVYLMPNTVNTIPENVSHRVGVGAFVMNSKREVLVVPENSGKFWGTNVWKLPTGIVNEGEVIWTAAERVVKEETGVEAKFVEVVAFRQSRESFFRKAELFLVCMLRLPSSGVQKQDIKIKAAQWMPVEEYAAQPSVQKNEILRSVSNTCLAKEDKDSTSFSKATIHKPSDPSESGEDSGFHYFAS